MPVGRIILKSISESKKLSQLKSDGARLLYTWFIPQVDINGCFSGDPLVVRNRILTRLKKAVRTVESFLQDLERVELIIRYINNGDIFLQVIDFEEKQPYLNPQREAKPTIPLPTPDQLKSKSGLTPPQSKSESKVKVNNIYALFKEKIKKTAKNISSNRDKIRECLNTFSEKQLTDIIIKKSKDKWFMDHNARRSIPWFFKDKARLKRYLEEDPPAKEESQRELTYEEKSLVVQIVQWADNNNDCDADKVNNIVSSWIRKYGYQKVKDIFEECGRLNLNGYSTFLRKMGDLKK